MASKAKSRQPKNAARPKKPARKSAPKTARAPAPKPLWQPGPVRVASSNITAFLAQVEQDWGAKPRN